MAITDGSNNELVMPVQPLGGGYGNNGFFGGNSGDNWLGILFLIAVCNGGFGGFGGWGGFGGFGNAQLSYDFPWLMNGQQNINTNTNNGFQNAMLNDGITSIRDGISGLSTQICGATGDIQNTLCNGFNGVNMSVNNAQNALAQQMYTNQLADLERSYASQTATTAGMNNLAMNLQNCCCENRAGIADLKYTVATENCADRAALSEAVQGVTMQNVNNTNAIIGTIRDGIQAIKDDFCQDRLDAERRENQNLRSELMYARGQASQVEQTAQLLANNNAQTAIFQQGLNNEVDALYNRLNNCPVATVPVYGRQPIFNCNQNGGCGCGVA